MDCQPRDDTLLPSPSPWSLDALDMEESEQHNDASDLLATLFDSGMSNANILALSADDFTGVFVLQIRRVMNLEALLKTYNALHNGAKLQQAVMKKRFTQAFDDLAEEHAVPVDDLKRAYNKLTDVSKARVHKRQSKSARASSEMSSTPASEASSRPRRSTTTYASPGSTASPLRRSSPMEPRMIPARVDDDYSKPIKPQPLLSQPLLEVRQRFERLRCDKPGSRCPRPQYYDPLVKALKGERKVTNMRGEELEQMSQTFASYGTEAIKDSFDCLFPGLGLATQEDVDRLWSDVGAELDIKVPEEDREARKWVHDEPGVSFGIK